MVEESFLDDTSLEINDTIDEVVFGGAAEGFLSDEPIVKDDLKSVQKEQKDREEHSEKIRKSNAEREKMFQEETDKYSKELKQKARKEKLVSIWQKLFFIFKPSNWVKGLQVFEPFIIALFVDLQLIIIIFSLLYMLYIILNVDAYSHFSAIFRLSGTLSLVILCIVIQLNSGSDETPNKDE